MKTLGIDDAGRGPVVGPMILAGCILDESVEAELKQAGVKDSKQLTQKRREFVLEKIKQKAEVFEISLTFPKEIDSLEGQTDNLNDLEAKKAAEIINRLNTGNEKLKVVVDCPSPNLTKWKDKLRSYIDNLSNLEIYCEHKADKNHVSVAAGSIIAKCKREEEMDKIKEKYPGIGSGYTSDQTTIQFLKKYALKYREEGIFRLSWATWKKAAEKINQKKLLDF